MPRLCNAALVCLLGFAAAPARAALPPDAGVFEEFAGPRSMAMGGAHRGLGTSNDTIYLNPAGMSAARRYAVELNYAYSPFDKLTDLNISALDPVSGPVAGALSYTLTRGDDDRTKPTLHRVNVAAAYSFSSMLALGTTVKHVRGRFSEDGQSRELSLYSSDVGVLFRPSELFAVGATAHNVIKEEVARMLPPTFGVGASVTLASLILVADVEIDAHRNEDTLENYHVGAEYFLADAFPLRIGYFNAPYTDKQGAQRQENVICAGVGWLDENGGFALSAQNSVVRPRNWSMVASMHFFL